MTLSTEKTRARLQAKQQRQRTADVSAGPELIRHFPAARFRGAVISGFWPLRGEIDVRPLLEALSAAGHRLALPCTPRAGKPLVMREWAPGDTLKIGSFDTREPFAEKAELVPNLVLMPLLAFTSTGQRLGYGGGFYDRTLAALRQTQEVFACGVAYAGQEAVSLPTGANDIGLDGILTEHYFKDF